MDTRAPTLRLLEANFVQCFARLSFTPENNAVGSLIALNVIIEGQDLAHKDGVDEEARPFSHWPLAHLTSRLNPGVVFGGGYEVRDVGEDLLYRPRSLTALLQANHCRPPKIIVKLSQR